LTPYSQNIKNLIDIKTLREEMTTWAVSHDSLSILKDHRSHVVPLVIRVLTPKVRKLKLLGSRKVCIYYCLSLTVSIYSLELISRNKRRLILDANAH
jgi:U3 small nucleolar RNA-associated protein 20